MQADQIQNSYQALFYPIPEQIKCSEIQGNRIKHFYSINVAVLKMDFFIASYFQLIIDNDKISIQKQEKTQNILSKVQEIMEKNDN